MSRPSARIIALATLGVAGLTAGVLAAATSPAAAANRGTYYTTVSTCAPATPGHAACYAMRRVQVSASSPAAAAELNARALPKRVANISYGEAGGFTPADLAKAYGVNAAAATTQTVGIVDAYNDPNARADLNTFDAKYALPNETSTSLRIVSQTGSTTVLPDNDTTGWSTEESLDLDAVRGLCHKCKIILVEADSNSGSDLATAVNEAVKLGATEVSNSYGAPDNDTTDPLTPAQAAAYNHPRVVITASTADDGYYDWDNANYRYAATAPPAGTQTTSSNAPAEPASLNTVVAVGGTTLQLNDDGTRAAESVWNENGTFDNTGYYAGAPQGATGGGCSTKFTAQKWQSSVANYKLTACGSKRLAADVSALADPYTGYDIYDSFVYAAGVEPGWSTYGGTSLASPLIAAMWALAGGSGGINYPSMSLYGHFKSASSSLYDVTAGGNGYCDGTATGECGSVFSTGSTNTSAQGQLDCAWVGATATVAIGTRACEAATGYDGPSGVGTPKGLSVFQAMRPTARITTPASVKHHKKAHFKGTTSTDPFPGGAISSYSWTWGDGSTSTGSSPKHKFASKGQYTITLTVKDSYGLTSAKASKKIRVK